MGFECKKLKITEYPGIGWTIEFSDSMEKDSDIMAVEELFHPTSRYLIIERSYPEDEYESEWYTIETSESDIEFNQNDKMHITLRPDLFKIFYSGEFISIGLNLSEKEYSKLKKTLQNQFGDKIVWTEI